MIEAAVRAVRDHEDVELLRPLFVGLPTDAGDL